MTYYGGNYKGTVNLPITYTTKYYPFAQIGKDVSDGVLTAVIYPQDIELGSFKIYGDYSQYSLADVPTYWISIGY